MGGGVERGVRASVNKKSRGTEGVEWHVASRTSDALFEVGFKSIMRSSISTDRNGLYDVMTSMTSMTDQKYLIFQVRVSLSSSSLRRVESRRLLHDMD